MPLSEESRPFAGYWGIIQAGVSVKASTAELWAEIRGFASEHGLQLGPGAFAAVNEMRGIAASMRRGAETFQAAERERGFDPSMAPPDISTRSPGAQLAQPEYLARFDLTYLDPTGEEVTRTVSMRDVWRPGMTVGDVYDAVQEAGEGLSLDYGQGFIGVANVRPVRV